MPEFRRPAQTPYEKRIDYDRLSRSQTARQAVLVEDLRKLLRQIEMDTLFWVDENLASKKLKTAIDKFKMPRIAKYRAIIRKRITMASRRGVSDVAGEADEDTPRLKIADLSRARARADALLDEHVNRLESDLKREWSKAMFGNVDKRQLRYVTRKVFADFAGWESPDGPNEAA